LHWSIDRGGSGGHTTTTWPPDGDGTSACSSQMGLARSSPTDRIDQVGSLEAGAAASSPCFPGSCLLLPRLASRRPPDHIDLQVGSRAPAPASHTPRPSVIRTGTLSVSKKKNTTLALSEESNNFKFDQILYKNLLIFMSPNIFLIKIYYMINVMILIL